MSVSAEPVSAASRRPASLSFLKLAGPGLVVAATGIGSGDVVPRPSAARATASCCCGRSRSARFSSSC